MAINWGDYLSDPGAWMAGLGTLGGLLGVGGSYLNNKRYQDTVNRAYNVQAGNASRYNASLDDFYGKYGNFLNQYNDQAMGLMGQFMDAYNNPYTPGDPTRFYQPITDAEKNALLRGVKSNMSERGIQPGGYYDAQTAEALGTTESQRIRDSIALANQQDQIGMMGYQARLGGLGAVLSRYGMMPPVAPTAYASPGYPPAGGQNPLGSLGSAFSPIGDYMKWKEQNTAANRMNNRLDDILRRANPGVSFPISTSTGSSGGGGYNVDPSVYDDPFGIRSI